MSRLFLFLGVFTLAIGFVIGVTSGAFLVMDVAGAELGARFRFATTLGLMELPILLLAVAWFHAAFTRTRRKQVIVLVLWAVLAVVPLCAGVALTVPMLMALPL